MAQYPVAPKAQAAGVAGAVSGALVYVLQQYAFHGSIPPGVESLIYAAIPGVLTFAAAYAAPHQDRPVPGMIPVPSPFTAPLATGTMQDVQVIPPAEDGEKLQAT